jgi:hypothetical protein
VPASSRARTKSRTTEPSSSATATAIVSLHTSRPTDRIRSDMGLASNDVALPGCASSTPATHDVRCAGLSLGRAASMLTRVSICTTSAGRTGKVVLGLADGVRAQPAPASCEPRSIAGARVQAAITQRARDASHRRGGDDAPLAAQHDDQLVFAPAGKHPGAASAPLPTGRGRGVDCSTRGLRVVG